MTTETIQHYTGQRAELLAHLVLTRRKDIQILSLGEKEGVGTDLITHIMKPIAGTNVNPYFGVQLKGTSNPLADVRAANRYANHSCREQMASGFILAPIVLMLFSMEGDKGYWGWVMEPFVDEQKSPSLQRALRLDMKEINNKSLDLLFSKVYSWFEAMVGVVLKTKEEK